VRRRVVHAALPMVHAAPLPCALLRKTQTLARPPLRAGQG